MEQSFWEARWGRGQIGFHCQDVNPNLVRHAQAWFALASAASERPLAHQRVFVPLAGKTVDATWLAVQGACVVAAEFVEQAVRSYFVEANLEPTERPFEAGLRFEASLPHSDVGGDGSVVYLAADFFALKREHLGALTAVYDRAALVAITPERRQAYVEQLARLTPPGARLLLVSFTHDQASGPPFSVPPEQVTRLLAPFFELECLADDDILEREPRYKDRGMTYFREHAWLGIRK